MFASLTHAFHLQAPLNTFAYLFSELVQYFQNRVSNVGDLERRLEDVGHGVGLRLLEILAYRERAGRRDTRLLDVLRFVHSTLWKYLFGRQAKDLEQSNTVRPLLAIKLHCTAFRIAHWSFPKGSPFPFFTFRPAMNT